MKKFFKSIPVVGPLLRRISALIHNKPASTFENTASYWQHRYQDGRTSGSGSYGRLAKFKTEIISDFIRQENINTAIEFGCGDGNQLGQIPYKEYIGLDISSAAVEKCKHKFAADGSKRFYVYSPSMQSLELRSLTAELALSLDVIYHIVEEGLYKQYLSDLMHSATRYVIIFSSDFDSAQENHVKHRKFSEWIAVHFPKWQLVTVVKNPYPYSSKDEDNTSLADFYFYKLVN